MTPRTRVLTSIAAAVTATALLSSCTSDSSEPYRFESTERGGGFVSDDGRITVVDVDERGRAPRISGRDLDGGEVDTAQWRGQVIVINIWGSWCPPCRREAPTLNRVARQSAAQGVRFLGLAIREEATASKAFADRLGLVYPSISDPAGQQVLGFADTLPAAAVPTTYVIDRRGRVAARILDEVSEPTLRGLIDDVLAEAS